MCIRQLCAQLTADCLQSLQARVSQALPDSTGSGSPHPVCILGVISKISIYSSCIVYIVYILQYILHVLYLLYIFFNIFSSASIGLLAWHCPHRAGRHDGRNGRTPFSKPHLSQEAHHTLSIPQRYKVPCVLSGTFQIIKACLKSLLI